MWWREYVPVARRQADAKAYAAKVAKKEKRVLAPVRLDGTKIAKTFWGKAWCDNLEAYSDFANRMPRGRTYVRNGSVIDLTIDRGKIKALVSGSDVYQVTIDITPLSKNVWAKVKADSAQSIDSLIDLLAGRFDDVVMKRLTRKGDGLFPQPREIKLRCSCPDYATMCKHCAAVLYGVGSRLDHSPEMLFTLRGVDHTELIGQAVSAENLSQSLGAKSGLATDDLGAMFGIDLVGSTVATEAPPKTATRKRATTAKAAVRKKPR